ncbi:Outer dense fiber protein 3, partial [Galemys pyrenaicus]
GPAAEPPGGVGSSERWGWLPVTCPPRTEPAMAEEVWVGAWRPHRPRGPIMALYSSPGPKYLIPPTTGFVKHTPTKWRAPAYSFRGAPMLLAENCSPGPRYSVNPKILRTGNDLGPAYSILGRYHTKTLLTPGPGDYFPERSTKHVFDAAPSHSISARTKTFRVDSTPGPGGRVGGARGRGRGRGRERRAPANSAPPAGPAAYMLPVVMGPRTVGKASQPSFSIKGRSKLGSFSDDLHKARPPRGAPASSEPGCSDHGRRGRGHRCRATQGRAGPGSRLSPPTPQTPGPAAYRQTDVQVTKAKAPQYTMAARVEPPGDKTLKPGPGAHSPEKVTVTKPWAPVVTFGIKHSDYMTPLIVDVE